ncbi:MAG: O-antigen ligase domain-containing protein [Pseudomonadota bacterium]
MATSVVRLHTFDEKVIFAAIGLSWAWYALGALYVVAPVLAWLMLFRIIAGALIAPQDSEFYPRAVPPLVWLWVCAMLVMEVALLVGHANFDLSIAQTIKSSVGWAKGWALLAIFPLLGACLNIRPVVLYRAAAWVALQTLILIPIFLAAPFIGLPETLYTSPLKMIGGPGPEFFQVQLFERDFYGTLRWRFFAPWAPAAALVYGTLLILLLRDRSHALRLAGLVTVLAVAVMCTSRLGIVAIPISLIATWGLSRLTNPRLLLLGAIGALAVGLAGQAILEFALDQKERIDQMRADSTYVREGLARIAIHRWLTEAPVWGHGIVENGPRLVEFMPIGSHHSWYGLLFVKGAVGFLALLIPLVVTVVELVVKAQKSRTARTALAFALLFGFFTFTENVEMLAYLMWPGLMFIGLAASERLFSPFRFPLGELVRHRYVAPAEPSLLKV